MSSPGLATATAPGTDSLQSQAQASHDSRLGIQQLCYLLVFGVALMFVLLILVGSALPPMPAAATAAHPWGQWEYLGSWGASIVERVKESATPVVTVMVPVLVTLLGTLTRGHMDLRVPLQKDGQ